MIYVDTVTPGGAAILGTAMLAALALVEALKLAISKIRPSGKDDKDDAKFRSRAYAHFETMEGCHLGLGAIDQRTGTPIWWGSRLVKEQEKTNALLSGLSAVNTGNAQRWETLCGEQGEAIRKQTENMGTQSVVLAGLLEWVQGCEMCAESRKETREG